MATSVPIATTSEKGEGSPPPPDAVRGAALAFPRHPGTAPRAGRPPRNHPPGAPLPPSLVPEPTPAAQISPRIRHPIRRLNRPGSGQESTRDLGLNHLTF